MSEYTGPTRNGPPNSAATAAGLPTVEPPSGRHILQMFLVPAVIVCIIVGIGVGVVWLFRGPTPPEDWLKKLKAPNPDVRWNAAADLAQYLLRDKDLSSDPDFALQLAALLDDALRESASEEKAVAERLAKVTDKEAREKEWEKIQGEGNWKSLDAHRKMIMYLGACLGNFTVPVGVPLLKEIAENTDGVEPRGLAERRWRAVFALANLGQKLANDYAALPDLRKDFVQSQLEKASQNHRFAGWSGVALEGLKKRRGGEPDMMGLDAAFEKITEPKSSDSFLRENVALALNFWTGTEAENDRMDRLLLKLTYDTGDSDEVLAEIASQNPEGFTPSEVRSLLVRYNANVALANRGSQHVRVPMLADMFDNDYLRDKMKSRRKDGGETTDETLVVNTLINTLKAVGTLHRKRPDLDLSSLRQAVDKLADHPNKAVQAEAKKLQQALDAS